jgi:hypothetical protein
LAAEKFVKVLSSSGGIKALRGRESFRAIEGLEVAEWSAHMSSETYFRGKRDLL